MDYDVGLRGTPVSPYGRVDKNVTPRTAKIASLGVFIFGALAALCTCGEDEYAGGPIGDANPNDPHPVWEVGIIPWAKYDQNGNRLLEVTDSEPDNPYGLNIYNGEIWTGGPGAHPNEIYIYDALGNRKKTVSGVGNIIGFYFDTHFQVVWGYRSGGSGGPDNLMKLDYDGNLLSMKQVPSAFGNLIAGGSVYENTGDLWLGGTGDPEDVVFKFDKNGDLISYKKLNELGLPPDFMLRQVVVDQTDGGVWLASEPRSWDYFLKLNANGEPVQKLYVCGFILDVGRKTGNLLVVYRDSHGDNLRLYTKTRYLLWQGPGRKQYHYGGINDFDGNCWASYGTETYKGQIEKISLSGETIIDDVEATGREIFIKNAPYPY